MKIRVKALLAFLFFGIGFVAAYLHLEEGVLGYFLVSIPFLKTMENYILLVLYGLGLLLAMSLLFGKVPRGAKGLYTVVTILLLLVFGYELYNEITFGLFFMGGGNLDVLRALFFIVGLVLTFILFISIRRGKNEREW